MQDSKIRRVLGILLFGLLLIALLILIAGIEKVQFESGYFFHLFDFQLASRIPGENTQFFFKSSLLITCIVLVILLIFLAVVPRVWRIILKAAIQLISLYILISILIHRLHEIWHSSDGTLPANENASKSHINLPLPVEPSDAFVYLISLILVLGLIAGVAWLFKFLRTNTAPSPLEEVCIKAEEALEQVRSGMDLKNVIIRCYAEMGEILDRYQQIKRAAIMTPREFETLLSNYAVPQEHVRNLTHLFEKVRYGRKEVGKIEEKQCTACLAALIQSCRKAHEETQSS